MGRKEGHLVPGLKFVMLLKHHQVDLTTVFELSVLIPEVHASSLCLSQTSLSQGMLSSPNVPFLPFCLVTIYLMELGTKMFINPVLKYIH